MPYKRYWLKQCKNCILPNSCSKVKPKDSLENILQNTDCMQDLQCLKRQSKTYRQDGKVSIYLLRRCYSSRLSN